MAIGVPAYAEGLVLGSGSASDPVRDDSDVGPSAPLAACPRVAAGVIAGKGGHRPADTLEVGLAEQANRRLPRPVQTGYQDADQQQHYQNNNHQLA
ncbi:MAG: hypothetical protein ACYST6_06705 [Planctomycetota bacterium]|jgi:hypothetical protein